MARTELSALIKAGYLILKLSFDFIAPSMKIHFMPEEILRGVEMNIGRHFLERVRRSLCSHLFGRVHRKPTITLSFVAGTSNLFVLSCFLLARFLVTRFLGKARCLRTAVIVDGSHWVTPFSEHGWWWFSEGGLLETTVFGNWSGSHAGLWKNISLKLSLLRAAGGSCR